MMGQRYTAAPGHGKRMRAGGRAEGTAAGLAIAGVVLADRVKRVDRHVRRIEVAGKAPGTVVDEVVARIMPLLVG